MNNVIEEGGAECTLEKSNLFIMLSELMLKGQGGGSPTENRILCYFCRGQAELTDAFYRKNVGPSRINRILKLQNTYNYLAPHALLAIILKF